MLTLRPAFAAGDRNSLIKEVTTGDPPTPRSLDRSIPRDLETVVLKAIAREPERRYQTAGEMAEDLHRFLADRPVRARRVSMAERIARWCRRNPAVAGLTAAVAVLLMMAALGSALAAAHFRKLAVTEHDAHAAAVEARTHAVDARLQVVAAQEVAETARVVERDQRKKADDARARADEGQRTAQEQRKKADASFLQARSAAEEYLNRVTEDQLLSMPGLQPLRLQLLTSAVKSYQDLLEKQDDAVLRSRHRRHSLPHRQDLP